MSGTETTASGNAATTSRSGKRSEFELARVDELVATLLIYAAILVGFGVRLYRLGSPNLINDEWFVLRSAHEGAGWIIALARTFEPHPPLYYLSAAGWTFLVGESEFALRFLGVAIGMLVIPAAGLIGRMLRHTWLAAAAAWLVALNPFLVANAQFARMYAPLAALTLLATAALLVAANVSAKSGARRSSNKSGHDRITPLIPSPSPATGSGARQSPSLRRGGRSWGMGTIGDARADRSTPKASSPPFGASTLLQGWPRYGACMLLAMLTHYGAWLLFAAHVVVLLLASIRWELPSPVRRSWTLTSAILAVCALAWLAYGLPSLLAYRGYFPDPVQPLAAVTRLLTVFAAGSFPSLVSATLALGAGVLALLGAAVLVRRHRIGGALLALAVCLPLLPSLYLMLTRPLFTERYVIGVVPPYLILTATGAVVVDRISRAPLATLALLAATAIALHAYYPSVEQGRPDFRAAARYVDALAQPGDLVVVTRHGTGELFDYYDNLELEQVVVDRDPLPALDAIAQRAPRNVWLLPAGEDQAQESNVARALLDAAHVVDDRWFRSARVIWYTRNARDEPRRRIDARWDDGLRLHGYVMNETSFEPGDALAVALYWSAEQPLQADYKLSLRFVDERGRVAAQVDRLPLNGLEPTRGWPPGSEVVDRQAIAVPPLLPGRYTLDLVVYDSSSLQPARLTIDGKVAASVTVGSITVDRASRPAAVPVLHEHGVSPPTLIGGLSLHAAHLLTRGVTLPEPVRVELRWQVLTDQLDRRPREVWLTLRGRGGTTVAEARQPLAENLPPTDWRPGETFWIRYDLPLPPTTETGSYALSASFLEAMDAVGREIMLGEVSVRGPERSYVAPTPTYPKRFRIGQQVELVGFDLSAERIHPGETVELTLYWHALGTPDRDYTVFTHLLDAATQLRGQHDQQPLGGRRPTTGWREGEYLVDTYHLRVDDSATTGRHEIEVGMYDPSTNVRLPTFGEQGQPLGDRIVLGQVEVMR